jgi:hypothetical protein
MLTECALYEGMRSLAAIREDWVTSEPESFTLDELRPDNGETWSVPSDVETKIFVRLVPEGSEGISVGAIQIDGNIVRFTVAYKESDDSVFTIITQEASLEPKVNTNFNLYQVTVLSQHLRFEAL